MIVNPVYEDIFVLTVECKLFNFPYKRIETFINTIIIYDRKLSTDQTTIIFL